VATSSAITPPQPQRPLARDRVNLLGTNIDRVERDAVADWIDAFVTSGRPHQIITANLDFVAIARRHPHFASIIEAADLVVCDGKPLQWASQIQGEPIPARVTGMDLVLTAAQLSAKHGYSIFFMGAAPGIAERAARALEQEIPGTVICGVCAPRQGDFDEEEDSRLVMRIRAAQPDMLFVALGAPRQDEWIHAHLEELNVPVCAGIGGVFNFLAGETRRAPEWIQQSGFEWAYRLAQEPSRLWRRYLVDDLPIFFQLLANQAFVRTRVRRATRPQPAPPADHDLAALAEYASDLPAASEQVAGEGVVRTMRLRRARVASVPVVVRRPVAR
jgi:N-acetylglucosaminyldiphosphoundecaprenol N-acetyl-beta-D-mannosaminyltransferase